MKKTPNVKSENTKAREDILPPVRMCICCRKRENKKNLIRVVMTDDGVCIDKKQNMQTRGFYICYNNTCIEKISKQKMLNRCFKQNISDNFYQTLNKEMGTLYGTESL